MDLALFTGPGKARNVMHALSADGVETVRDVQEGCRVIEVWGK
ncbi:hypothetical protein [Cyanobium sp. LEGE 06143]|nr:hypothetical protein [Cyanobium sp. LEGE 06143]